MGSEVRIISKRDDFETGSLVAPISAQLTMFAQLTLCA